MTEHTPGPWRAERSIPEEGFDCWWIRSGKWNEVTTVPPAKEADARLIAAAPTFYATAAGADPEIPEVIRPVSWLWSMIDECRSRGPSEDCDDPDAFWKMVREVEELHQGLMAAIAKAEGRG